MKRKLFFLLALLLTLSPLPAAQAAGADFSDVSSVDWFAPYVDVCVEEGLMNGVGNGCFAPNAPLALDQMLVLASRLYDRQNGGDGNFPPLPERPEEWLQVFDSEGRAVANMLAVEEISYFDRYGRRELWLSFQEPLEEQTLTFQIGFPGDTVAFRSEGSFVAGETVIDTDPFLNAIIPEGAVVSRTSRDHYAIPIPQGRDVWDVHSLVSSYKFFMDSFDEYIAPYWEKWYYPAVYALNYREGVFLNLSSPHLEQPELQSEATAWREDLVITLCSLQPDLLRLYSAPELPDVPGDRYDEEQTQAILAFYQAGVLKGTGPEGRFDGTKPLTRAEAAAILARILRPELRLGS